MRAIVVREDSVSVEQLSEEFLPDAPITVDVHYSCLNYKDALAVTGRPGVVRTTPLIAGIDLVGIVRSSASERFSPGDWLVVNGGGLSETKHGGFATVAKIDPTYAVALPEGFSPQRAAALGTAGYTAALAVLRLVMEGVSPDQGPVLVTGATGGVGSVATMLLHSAGFDVAAVTGRVAQLGDYLTSLGADEVLARSEFLGQGKPLQRATYAGAIDSVGGEVLANAIARTIPDGTVATCGLAGSAALPGTVMPFILRGVTLAGINSVTASLDDRQDAWRVLAQGVPTDLLDAMTTTITLDETIAAGQELLDGNRHGRTLVRVAS